ncbi:preprotein translocase subunit SecE [Mycoplasma tauri]|uniref:Preprotein translocase subunit SecE n=1 Tax=Mycoplasma tauri TaxID=547987 RepID=A0A953NGI4_9MOLU|nr:preprotein translocase subunit SecE [Mycoplasma tauri]MBZ4195460.1 preprotein translocase subunit SecE [Mycoplasma tauri]MBZ4203860.1 preprotein translocase subunit SecE [Mycoplasma tauri]MBZ4203984.1 preprotein translocase subunit SecE [Mycoplasma tauri]MBZ4212800.1 preprotein translocase subunit SecE [Mycoplasma tauri]MBZ4218477.1 preprotein translocase subunit SecE [Mycoplasma tauri]
MKKQEKKKKYYVRKFIKELKRVRWPSAKKSWASFVQVIIFTIIFTLIVIGFFTLVGLAFTKTGINSGGIHNA